MNAITWGRAFAVVVGFMVYGLAMGQTCYEYRREDGETWHFDHVSACAEGLPRDDAPQSCGAGTFFFRFRYAGFEPTSSSHPVSGACLIERVSVGVSGNGCGFPIGGEGGAVQLQRQLSHRIAAECPGPEVCTPSQEWGTGETFVVGTVVPRNACHPITKCRMARGPGVCIDDSCVFQVTHTDEPCSDFYDPPLQNDAGDDEECVSEPGSEFCLAKHGNENCGYFNDEFVCLSRVRKDACKVFSDGGRVCGTEAPVPPVPDNGTPGKPALPDEVINITNVDNSQTTLNYYNGGTVAGSSRDPGQSGDNPYDGRGGGSGSDGDCVGEECWEGSVEGGVTCEVEPQCTGDALQCEIIAQSWRNRCVVPLTEDQLDAMFSDGRDIDGDGVVEGRGEGLPGSGDDPIDVMEYFDSQGWLGSRTCPASFTVDLPAPFGGPIMIPLGDACWFFQLIGNIVLVLAWFQAARIVVTGFN